MKFAKLFLSVFLLLSVFFAFSQNTESVFLKWKLKPGEILSYKTSMDEIDTAHSKDFDMSGLEKLLPSNFKSDTGSQKLLKRLSESFQDLKYVTHLKEDKHKIINIEMISAGQKPKPTNDTSEAGRQFNQMQAMMAKAQSGVSLRGGNYGRGTHRKLLHNAQSKSVNCIVF